MPLRLLCSLTLAVIAAHGQAASGSVSGTVVDVTNAGIPGVLVTVESPMPMAGSETDPSGKFTIAGVPPGNYTLRLQVAGFRPRKIDVQIGEGRVTSIGSLTMDIVPPLPCIGAFKTSILRKNKLPPGGKPLLSGTTRSESGGVLTHFTLTLLMAGTSKEIGTTSTDENGSFHFMYLMPGTYELLVSYGGAADRTRVRRIKVSKGRETHVGLIWNALPQGYICL